MSFLGYLVQGEDGIVHYLSGYVPHAIWTYWIPADVWISLFILATLAAAFELVENTPGAGKVMWTWIGYSDATYHTDTLRNSQSDVLFLLAGWLTVQVVHLLAPSATAFWVLMGVAGALFVLFVWLFTKEREQWHIDKRNAEAARAASIAPTGVVLDPLARVPRIVGVGARSSMRAGTASSVGAPVAPAAEATHSHHNKPRVSFVL